MEPIYCDANENQVFNHNFSFPNQSGDFPAGWQIYRGHKTASFYWKKDDKLEFSIKIKNRSARHLASICQERFYRIPVYEKQVWEVGAQFKVEHDSSAKIIVHFVSHSSSPVLSISLDFGLEPECSYYYGIVTVPEGVDYALIEVGTSKVGTLLIEDVFFRRVFPIEKYSMDAQGRLNINTVEEVKRIIEPVDVKGTFELKRPTIDFIEDVIADSTERGSTIQDVLNLTSYSFCVINQGSTQAAVRMQLSPNGINWIEDPIADNQINAGELKILVYDRFTKYVRLKYRTNGGTTSLRIFFQGQG